MSINISYSICRAKKVIPYLILPVLLILQHQVSAQTGAFSKALNNINYTVDLTDEVPQDCASGLPGDGVDNWFCNIIPDGTLAFLSNLDGTYQMYYSEYQTYRTIGNRPIETMQASPQIPVMEGIGSGDSYDDGGIWLMSVERLCGDNLIGFFHAEDWWSFGGGLHQAYKSMGVARSYDNGYSWTRVGADVGQIVTSDEPKPAWESWSGAGDGDVIWDWQRDRWVMYYQEACTITNFWGTPVPLQAMLHMAHSYDREAKPGTWYKYNWDFDNITQPGLGGTGRPVTNLAPIDQGGNASTGVGANPDIIWNTYLNKWIMVWHKHDGSKIWISFSDDLMHWTLAEPLIEGSGLKYVSIMGEHSDKEMGKDGYLYYATGSPRFHTRRIEFTSPDVITGIRVGDLCGVSENAGEAVFRLSLSQPATATVTLEYYTADDTALGSSDYSNTTGTVVINMGEQYADISVPLVNDSVLESDERFSIHLTNALNAEIMDPRAYAIIVDDDHVPQVSISETAAYEDATNVIFQVTLSKTYHEPVSVNYQTADGSALAGSDFNFTSGTLVVSPGLTSGYILIPIIDDSEAEATEDFSLMLTGAVNGNIAVNEAAGYILYNDGTDGGSNITEGLLAHWKFDEEDGYTAYDSVGSHDGRMINFSPDRRVMGRLDRALEFDGRTTYISVSNVAGLRPTNLTVSVWYKRTASLTERVANYREYHFVYAKPPATPSGDGWALKIDDRQNGTLSSQKNLSFNPSSSQEKYIQTSIGPNEYFPLNEWIHLVVTYNFADATGTWPSDLSTIIYTNGIYHNTLSQVGFVCGIDDLSTYEPIIIGRGGWPYEESGGWMLGHMDDLRLYGRALSSNEVRDLYLYDGREQYVVNTNVVLPPDVPQGVTAYAVMTDEASFAWIDTAGEDGYIAYLSLTADVSSAFLVSTLVPDTTNITFTGLNPDQQYYFWVEATNSGGGALSSAVSVMTLSAAAPVPDTPTGLYVTDVSTNQLGFIWTDVSNETGYITYLGTTSNASSAFRTNVLTADITNIIFTGLDPDQQYYFRVEATNGSGGSLSLYLAAATLIPAADAPIEIYATNITTNAVSFIWTDVPNETGYVVYLGTAGSISSAFSTNILSADDTNVSYTGLSPNQLYYFWVEATNSTGGSFSLPASAATLPLVPLAPDAPTGVQVVNITSNELSFVWTDVSNESSYTAYLSTANDPFSAFQVITLAGDTTNITFSSLEPDVQYYFWIEAVNGIGGALSLQTDAATLPARITFSDKEILVGPNPCCDENGPAGVIIQGVDNEAEVRIYTIDGYLIRKFTEDDISQAFMELEAGRIWWDLKNSDEKLVGSGLYIIDIKYTDRSVKLKLHLKR